MATYKQIQEFIKNKYGYIPKTCWIAHAKELSGIKTNTAANRISDQRTHPCPIDRLPHMQDAFRHFNMI